MTDNESTSLPQVGAPEESIPEAYVPWNRDDDRARYLGLRCSGFTIREALTLIGKSKSALSGWRHDPKFVDLEDRIPELRKSLGMEYVAFETLRNFRLVLEKDYRVLKESLQPHKKTVKDAQGNTEEVDVGMNEQDFKYLLAIRSNYTPAQLKAIEELFNPSKGDKDTFEGWTDFFLARRRTTTEEFAVGTRHRQEPELSQLNEEYKGEGDR